jgi:hypothetical protein
VTQSSESGRLPSKKVTRHNSGPRNVPSCKTSQARYPCLCQKLRTHNLQNQRLGENVVGILCVGTGGKASRMEFYYDAEASRIMGI